jgi:hypothetical protein
MFALACAGMALVAITIACAGWYQARSTETGLAAIDALHEAIHNMLRIEQHRAAISVQLHAALSSAQTGAKTARRRTSSFLG